MHACVLHDIIIDTTTPTALYYYVWLMVAAGHNIFWLGYRRKNIYLCNKNMLKKRE